MLRRTTILVEPDVLEHYSRRARVRGTTVSQEIRAALRQGAQETIANPNQWLLDLADAFADVEFPSSPSIDSEEWKKAYSAALEHESMGHEPAR